jgi:hypothetical protein
VTSPRLRPYFDMQLIVTPVDPSSRRRTLDIRRTTLRARISECARLIGLEISGDKLDGLCDKILSNPNKSPAYIVTGEMCDISEYQHAECSILLHHLQNPKTNPSHYFGVF